MCEDKNTLNLGHQPFTVDLHLLLTFHLFYSSLPFFTRWLKTKRRKLKQDPTSDNDHHRRRQLLGLRRHRRQPRGLRRSGEVFDGTDESEDLDGNPTTPASRLIPISSIYFRYFRLGFVLEFDIVDFQKLKYLLVDFHLVFCEFEMLLFE